MMSMLSSYTLPSLAPAPAPVKLSPAGALQQRKQQAASSLVVAGALPWAPRKESRSRASLFTCHAGKYDDIPTDALSRRPTSPSDHEDRWKIKDDEHHILFMLNVGESTTMKDLNIDKVDPGLLHITGATGGSLEGKLDVRLVMPPGYDIKKVTAVIVSDGWLQVTVVKPKPTTLPITDARAAPQT